MLVIIYINTFKTPVLRVEQKMLAQVPNPANLRVMFFDQKIIFTVQILKIFITYIKLQLFNDTLIIFSTLLNVLVKKTPN